MGRWTWVCVWVWAAACGGSSGLADGECRTAEDCDDGLACHPPDWDPGCGYFTLGCAPGGYACATGEYCSETNDACIDAVCRLECSDDAGCDADERCDTGSGECRPWSCEDGFECDSQSDCNPSSGDDNGCFRRTCSSDGDCPGAGLCVEGRCFEGAGTCGTDEPVP